MCWEPHSLGKKIFENVQKSVESQAKSRFSLLIKLDAYALLTESKNSLTMKARMPSIYLQPQVLFLSYPSPYVVPDISSPYYRVINILGSIEIQCIKFSDSAKSPRRRRVPRNMTVRKKTHFDNG